jgi:phospholipase/carboxylesterase
MGPMTLRSHALEMSRRQFGPLDCTTVIPRGKSPEFCVVLCHGFGAPGTDLVPLSQELAELVPGHSDQIAYIFPEAPLELGGYGFGGRAWWMVDVGRFQAAMSDPRLMAEMRTEIPVGMPEASRMLRTCVEEIGRHTGIPLSRTLLGGFSQGSMVATDVALELTASPAGLCIFSGHLLTENKWRELAPNRRGMPVLQTHGRFDPLLPFEGAEQLRDLLIEAGVEVEFISFGGPHTISMEGISRCAALMARVFVAGPERA